MPFLSSKTLKKRIPREEIIIPFEEERIKYAAYELSLGREAYVTTDEKKQKYEDDDQVVIHPGQFALLITEEKVKVPNNLIAFISIKFSIKSEGLINVSGFHVDPGFEGKLKFYVYNAGVQNVNITVGDPTFQIWFSELSDPVKYDGNHNGQNSITSSDVMKAQGKMASPHALSDRIDKLESRFKIVIALLIGILVTTFSGNLSCSRDQQKEIPSEVQQETNSAFPLDNSSPEQDSL